MKAFRFNSDAVAVAKGVTILLMVMLHAGCPRYVDHYVVMFHMPLFFIMSGYCFKMKYLGDAHAFVRKRVRGIWRPYVKWVLVFLVLHNVLFHLNVYNDVYGYRGEVSHLYTWREFAVKFIKTFYMGHNEQLLGGFWFLKELFWCSLIGYGMIWLTERARAKGFRYLTSFSLRGGVMLIFLLAFAYMGKEFHVPVVGISQRTWMASFFFLFGQAWRGWEERGTWLSRFDSAPRGVQVVVVLALALIVKLIIVLCGHSSMISFNFYNALPYVVAALCGSMMVVYVSRWLVSMSGWLRSFLVFTGRHTLEVLTWHFSCFKLVSLLLIAVYGLDIEYLAWHPVINTDVLQGAGVPIGWSLWWVVYFVVGAGVPLAVQWLRFKGREQDKYK